MSADTAPLTRDPLPLRGRNILVTGVSRRAGIGFALACRLAAYGASVFCHHYSPHDEHQPWGADDPEAVLTAVRTHLVGDARAVGMEADLAEASGPEAVVDAAVAQAFLRHHTDGDPAGIVFLTSGQGQGPMPGEVAYAAAKAALAGVTLTLADQLADRGIRVNTVNPGPVDSGYLTPEAWETVAQKFPLGRFGEPDDAARILAWLLTDEAHWITGQVIDSEGGFARWR